MRRVKLLGLALVAVFAASVAISSTAIAALPEILPTSASERSFTGGSDGANPKLFSSAGTVECNEAPATGTEEAGKPLGQMHIEFKGCKSKETSATCTGLGDTSGIILALGTWHAYWDELTPELNTGVVILIEKVHFNCTALVLITVLGDIVCLWLKLTEKNATHLFHCVSTEAGVQEDQRYWDASGNEVKEVSLDCGINGGTEKPCGELALGSVTYKEPVFADL